MKKILLISAFFIFLSKSLYAERLITDQTGRTVKIPDKVDRVVVLQHHTLDVIIQLNATSKVKGVLTGWQKKLGSGFERLAPELQNLPTPGDLTSVDIESLLAIKPQVVFVTNYAPKDMIELIQSNSIPVIAISFREDSDGQKDKLNPLMSDEEKAYSNGFKEGVKLIAEVLGKQKEAEELLEYVFYKRHIVEKRLEKINQNERVSIYMANPGLTTYGKGKYTGIMMKNAGGINVAAKTIDGFKQISMEQVLSWNPEVIFVQDRYPDIVDQIMLDPLWKNIRAVKDKRVYLMPEYAKAWGYPTPEALAIGEMWMAKKLYPALFKDIDMTKEANDYYRRFYRVTYDEGL